jgi:hypothetical protein
MEPLINKHELRNILERGLLSGKWSVVQFNKGGRDVVLPSEDFLKQHQRFTDMEFRDLAAFRKEGHQ